MSVEIQWKHMAGPGIEPRTLATLSGALPLSHHADIHGPFSPNYYKFLQFHIDHSDLKI